MKVVFLRVTNHTGKAEKNLLGPAGIEPATFDFNPMLYQLTFHCVGRNSSFALLVKISHAWLQSLKM